MKTVVISMRTSPETANWVAETAKSQGMTMNDVMKLLLTVGARNITKEEWSAARAKSGA